MLKLEQLVLKCHPPPAVGKSCRHPENVECRSYGILGIENAVLCKQKTGCIFTTMI